MVSTIHNVEYWRRGLNRVESSQVSSGHSILYSSHFSKLHISIFQWRYICSSRGCIILKSEITNRKIQATFDTRGEGLPETHMTFSKQQGLSSIYPCHNCSQSSICKYHRKERTRYEIMLDHYSATSLS